MQIILERRASTDSYGLFRRSPQGTQCSKKGAFWKAKYKPSQRFFGRLNFFLLVNYLALTLNEHALPLDSTKGEVNIHKILGDWIVVFLTPNPTC